MNKTNQLSKLRSFNIQSTHYKKDFVRPTLKMLYGETSVIGKIRCTECSYNHDCTVVLILLVARATFNGTYIEKLTLSCSSGYHTISIPREVLAV